jgi:hypothetical protein
MSLFIQQQPFVSYLELQTGVSVLPRDGGAYSMVKEDMKELAQSLGGVHPSRFHPQTHRHTSGGSTAALGIRPRVSCRFRVFLD